MKNNLYLFCAFCVILCQSVNNLVYSQVINAYARVTAISGTTLTLANVNETYHTFNVGEKAILIQMQDDVIGSTADDATFGDLGSVGSAGLYEVVTITNKTLPTIQVASITNSYNTCANCRVQLVSFRRFGNQDYTTTSNISALAWDGNIGGIIAMEVPGTLTLNHNISADGAGFRGGATSIDYYDGTYNCYPTPYRANDNRHGFKGEGIYVNTSATYNNARAKILNGGGGGNHINAGGGGGGNWTAGGRGGPGWNGTDPGCPVATGGYGYGGIALSSFISSTRVFMGGGGGGGQQNNSAATPGGNGGGIIFLKANQIVTTGTCTSRIISANGVNASNTVAFGNDGAGGGGAGGTIVLQVPLFSLTASCPLIVRANGGNGGTVLHVTHGGGGAGGQGAIFVSAPSQPANSTFQTLNGTPGCNNNSNPCNNIAGSASGTNNSGIFFLGYGTPLPVNEWHFTASIVQSAKPYIVLSWQNNNQLQKGKFTILKSYDMISWVPLIQEIPTDNENSITSYEQFDFQPHTENYYQLIFTDLNGNVEKSNIQTVILETPVTVFPNPFTDNLTFSGLKYNDQIEIYDEKGSLVYHSVYFENEIELSIVTNQWKNGLYFIRITNPENSRYFIRKVVK